MYALERMTGEVNTERELDEAEIFHILGNDRRRATINGLAESGGSIAVSELAEQIAAQEADTEEDAQKLYKSVYVSLRQTHLPKLEEQGIIQYDADNQRIMPGAQMNEIQVYTDGTTGLEAVHRSVYLVVSVIGLLTIIGAQLGVPVLNVLAVEVWAVIFLTLIIVLGVYQQYR